MDRSLNPERSLAEEFGQIDIYLFDQLLKNRIPRGSRILDAGCGSGRNLVYFLRRGDQVYANDQSSQAVEHVIRTARALQPSLPTTNFRVEAVEALTFEKDFFDLVISSAVLHFAENRTHFDQMLNAMWRVVRPGGIFFARLASSIGLEERVAPLGDGRFRLPDGTERYLVDERTLQAWTEQLKADLLEPLKTTNVQNLRCMTTWCLTRRSET